MLLRNPLPSSDEAYDTRKYHDAIAGRNAHAAIPPFKDAKPWKPESNEAIARNQSDKVPAPYLMSAMEWLPPPKLREPCIVLNGYARPSWRGTSPDTIGLAEIQAASPL